MINGDMGWGLCVGLGRSSVGIIGPGDMLLNELVCVEGESALGLAFDGWAESFALEFAGERGRGAWLCDVVRVGGSEAY